MSGNKKVTYYELNSIFGHDTFLLDINNVGAAVKVGIQKSYWKLCCFAVIVDSIFTRFQFYSVIIIFNY